MPFKSSAQLRVCVGKAQDDIGKGKRPSWNCEAYMCKDGNKSPTCNRIRRGGAIGSKIHQGPRGGYYFEIEEKKFYIAEKNRDAMLKKFGVEDKPVRLSPSLRSPSSRKNKINKNKKSPTKRNSKRSPAKRRSGRKSPSAKRK